MSKPAMIRTKHALYIFVVTLIFVLPFATYADPVIQVVPEQIGLEINTGQAAQRELIVRNLGDQDLVFRTEKHSLAHPPFPGLHQPEPGDRLATFNTAHSHISGMTFDGRYIWVLSWDEQNLFAIDPNSREVVQDVELWTRLSGLGYDPVNELFWMGVDNTPRILRVNRNWELVDEFRMPHNINGDFTSDGEFMYWLAEVNPQDANENRIYKMSFEGEILDELAGLNNAIGHGHSCGIQYVDNHHDGHFWIASVDGQITQTELDFDNDRIIIRQGFWARQDNQNSGLSHDGNNIWATGSWGTDEIMIWEDGIDECNWISLGHEEGVIAPQEELELELSFDTYKLRSGEYVAELAILSNDPRNPEAVVQLSIDVTAAADIAVTWPLEYGYPENVDYNRLYLDLLNDDIYEAEIQVLNEGNEVLEIEGIEFTNEDFFVRVEEFMIDPGENRALVVYLDADESEMHAGQMIFHSNDPDGDYRINLAGLSGTAPEMVIDPEDVNEQLINGAIAEHPLAILNTGGIPLRWNINHEMQEHQSSNDLGVVKDKFHWEVVGLNQRTAGISWDPDNEWMWLSCYERDRVAAVDPARDYEVQIDFFVDNPMDNAWFKGYLYQIPWSNNRLDRFMMDGTNVGALNLAYRPTAVAAKLDEDLLLVLEDGNFNLHIIDVWDNHREIARVDNIRRFTENRGVRSIEWDNSPPDMFGREPEGRLWVNTIGRLYQLHVNPENWQDIQTIRSVERWGNDEWDGVGHDGENLWLGSRVQEEIEIWGDGFTPARWLDYEPNAGRIIAEEEQEVMITLNAQGLVAGDYSANLHIHTNDPEAADFVLPVELTVEGEPQVIVEWGEQAGYPEGINFNELYYPLYGGEHYDFTLDVVNSGQADLVVSDIIIDNEFFEIDTLDFILAPYARQEVRLRFFAPVGDEVDQDATLSIHCDDPDEDEVRIPVIAQLTAHPIIAINPEAIEAEMFTGETTEHVLTVSNEGESPLSFIVEKNLLSDEDRDAVVRSARSLNGGIERLHRDRFGQELDRFDLPYNRTGGMAWDGQYVWGTDYDSRRLFCIDPDNYDVIRDFQIESRPMGMAWDAENEVFYIVHWDVRELYIYDRNANLIGTIDTPGRYAGVAFDGEFLYVSSEETRHLYKMTLDGEVVGLINDFRGRVGHDRAICITWVPGHENGHLWVKARGWIAQVNPDFENDQMQIVSEFRVGNDQGHDAITHDGNNLWVSDHWERRIGIIYDDGIDETYWLSYEPDQGQLEPGEQTDINITFSSRDMATGNHYGRLHFISNDPENPQVIVPLTMEVTVASIMEVTWDAEFGYPDNMDWNRLYPDLFTDNEYEAQFTVRNLGLGEMVVENVSCDEESYTFDPEEFNLQPNEEQIVTITFEPFDDGDHEAEVVIEWNSPDDEPYLVPIVGHTASPPVLTLEPNVVEEEVFTGERREHEILVINEGDSPLRYQIQYEDPDPFTGARGWFGQYYHNPAGHNPAWGELVLERVDEYIDFNWGAGGPGDGVRNQNFGVRWTAQFIAEIAGTYRFRTLTDDGIRLYIDGERIYDRWNSGGDFQHQRNLSAGLHTLMFEMYENSGSARAHLWWMLPGENEWILMPGIQGFPWIELDKLTGTVAPGDEDIVTLTLVDNAEIEEGEHNAEMIFTSNDPENPEQEFLINMFFTEEPQIEVFWSRQHGYPHLLDWNLEYNELFTDTEYAMPITIHNTGDLDLFVMQMRAEHNSFSSFERPFFLHPDEEIEIEIILDADEPGVLEGDLHFVWNSPRDEDYILPVHAEVMPPPRLELGFDELQDDLFTGDIIEHVLNLTNNGESAMDYTIDHRYVDVEERDNSVRSARTLQGASPYRDNPGQILSNFHLGNLSRTIGLCWDPDNQIVWGLNHSDPQILYSVNPENGEILNRFDLENLFVSLFYLDGVINTGGWSRNPWAIYRYDTNGNILGRRAAPRNIAETYLHSNGQYLFTNRWNDGYVQVWDWENYEDTFEEIGRINYADVIGLRTTRSLHWVDAHQNGHLWLSGNNNRLYQINVNTEDWSCEHVQNFGVPRGDHAGLTHDGRDLWRAAYTADTRLYRIDDGINEFYWLNYSHKEGRLLAGDELNLNLILDATGLPEDSYAAELVIETNDPEALETIIDITIEVSGAPVIEVVWEEAYGYPEFVDWNVLHLETYAQRRYDVPITISNTGNENLHVWDIYGEDNDFDANPDQFVIRPGEEAVTSLQLDADNAGDHVQDITIEWNSPHEQDYIIEGRAHVIGPPIITVDPMEIAEELITDFTSNHQITIGNEGEAVLRFLVESEIIREPGDDEERDNASRSARSISTTELSRDRAGDLIDEFGVPYSHISGLAWDGRYMWFTSYGVNRIFCVDPDNYEIVRDYPLPTNIIGLTYNWDTEILLTNHWGSTEMYEVDKFGNILNTFNLPRRGNGDYAYDGEFYYWSSEDANCFYKLNEDWQIVGTINNMQARLGHGRCIGLTWAEKHEEGHFWFQTQGWICQVVPDFQNNQLQKISEFRIDNGHSHEGIAHDGYNLWTGGHWDQQVVRIYDDGIEEHYWYSYEPNEGVLEQDEEMVLNLTFDAYGLLGGEYEANIFLETNDPDAETVEMPILLSVVSAPAVELTWSEEAGYPEEVNWNGVVENLYTDWEYDIVINIENSGTENLVIENIECDNDYFTSDPPELNLAAGESEDVTFTLNPAENGVHEGEMRVTWNSPVDEDIVIPVAGESFTPPIISLDPGNFEFGMNSGEYLEEPVMITNVGEQPLTFDFEWETDEDIWNGQPGFNARYYRTIGEGHDPEWGDLVMERVDRRIAMDWGWNAPGGGVPRDNWGVKWTGYVLVTDPGMYDFQTYTDDGARLWIDGTMIIDRFDGGGRINSHFELDFGWHFIEMHFYDIREVARAYLYWVKRGEGELAYIEEAYTDKPWLMIANDSHELEPGADSEVTFIFDMEGVEEGAYAVNIPIATNDPAAEELIFPVTVQVAGSPAVQAKWNARFGYPDALNWGDIYEDLFVDEEYSATVKLKNIGVENLVIDDITCENEAFTAEPTEAELEPGEEISLEITLNSAEEGEFEENMVVTWNSPNDEDYLIPLYAFPKTPPEVDIQPNMIEEELYYGEEFEFEVNVSNNGSANMRYHVWHEIIAEPNPEDENEDERDNISRTARRISGNNLPMRDNAGDVLAEYELPRSRIGGFEFDGEFLWATDYSYQRLYKYDPDGFELLEDSHIQDHPMELIWVPQLGVFWISTWVRSSVYVYDRDAHFIDELEMPAQTGGIAFDGEFVYWHSEPANRLYKLNLDREVVGEMPSPRGTINHGRTTTLEYVPEHEPAPFWIQSEGYLSRCRLDFENDQIERVSEFQITNRHSHNGIAHDGKNFWSAGHWDQNICRVIDDGIDEIHWLTYDLHFSELEGGEDENFFINLNTFDLIGGQYEADIHLTSNDPENPDIVLGVVMTVESAPQLELTWPEDVGYPEIIDFSNAHLDQFTTVEYAVPVIATNVGVDTLEITGFESDNEFFSADIENITIPPAESDTFNVLLLSQQEGVQDAEMHIQWNSPREEDYEINLTSELIDPPIIVYDPAEVVDSLHLGDRHDHEFTLTNIGPGLLRVEMPWWENEEIWSGEPGFFGEYFHNSWRPSPPFGQLVMTRIDPVIMFSWGVGGPGGGVRGEAWGARWNANFWCEEEGDYFFRCRSDDGQNLYIDGVRVVSDWRDHGETNRDVIRHLERGIHSVRYEYYNYTGHAGAYLWWRPPGQEELEPLPGHQGQPFVFIDPQYVEVETGDEVNFTISVDAVDLEQGDHEAAVILMTNDPASPEIDIPISVNVSGAPILDIVWDEKWDFPERMFWNNEYYALYIDGTYDIPMTIRNTGIETAVIEEIICEDESFTAEPSSFEIEPEGEQEVIVTFHTDRIGNHESELRIVWNSPYNEDHVIPVKAEANTPPEIAVDLQPMRENLRSDEVRRFAFTIANEGQTRLQYHIGHDVVADPTRDVPEFMEEEIEVGPVAERSARGIQGFDDLEQPDRDATGDLIHEFNYPYIAMGGLAWDGELMWGVSYDWRRLIAIDPTDYSIVHNMQTHRQLIGMAWDDLREELLIGGWTDNYLYRYNRRGELLGSIRLYGTHAGVAYDGEFIYWNTRDHNICIKYNREGEELGRITNILERVGHGNAYTLTYVPQHWDGHFWMFGVGWIVQARLDFDNDELTVLQEFRTPNRYGHEGISHDGFNLWTGGYWNRNQGFVYDDGISEGYWLQYHPYRGRVQPGEDVDISLALDATDQPDGEHTAQVHITSNDPDNSDIVIPVTMHVGTRPIDWTMHYHQPQRTQLRHRLSIIEMYLEDELMDGNDEIAVYTQDNLLAGAAVCQYPRRTVFYLYGDDPQTDEIEGFTAGEQFAFRVWDEDTGREHNAVSEVFIGEDMFEDGARTVIDLHAEAGDELDEITVNLRETWNMISINVVPEERFWTREEGPDIVLMTNQLRYESEQGQQAHHLEIMKDVYGRFYATAWGFNNIPYWDLTQGYLLKSDAETELYYEGETIPANAPLTLNPAWNMVAYFPDYELSAAAPDFYVLSDVIDRIVMAKDIFGNFLNPTFRFSNMDPWRPTQGYMIQVTEGEAFEFLYPEEQQVMASATEMQPAENVQRWIVETMSSENMSVLLNSLVGIETKDGDQLLAFSDKGELVGSGVVSDGRCGLAVWGDNDETNIVEGLLAEESFGLRYYQRDTDVLHDLETTEILAGSGLHYTRDDLLVLIARVTTSIPDEYYLAQNYPNPFNSTTRLSFGLPNADNVQIGIYDLQGRLVETLINGDLQPGNHFVTWHADDIPAGMYVVQMKSGNGFESRRKVTLVK